MHMIAFSSSCSKQKRKRDDMQVIARKVQNQEKGYLVAGVMFAVFAIIALAITLGFGLSNWFSDGGRPVFFAIGSGFALAFAVMSVIFFVTLRRYKSIPNDLITFDGKTLYLPKEQILANKLTGLSFACVRKHRKSENWGTLYLTAGEDDYVLECVDDLETVVEALKAIVSKAQE